MRIKSLGLKVKGKVRRMDFQDLNEVVDIHLDSFSGFFLSTLGQKFLNQLYKSILADQFGIAFVFHNRDGIQGFVAGTAKSSGFYRRILRKHWWSIGLVSILPAIKHPLILTRIFHLITKPAGGMRGRGTLMSIAVSPGMQGQGIGAKLIQVFLTDASKRKVLAVDLRTDRYGNENVNLFYERNGFKLHSRNIEANGREMNEYLFYLKEVNIGGE